MKLKSVVQLFHAVLCRPMATASFAKTLGDGLSCSLCHKYFTEPVSIECGQSFCRACIACHWDKWEIDFSCPRCGEISLKRKFTPNKELGNVAEITKRMKVEMAESEGVKKVCELHQEPLKPFCKEEQKLLCVTCVESMDHPATHVSVAVEEAVQDYKEELETQLQAWREKKRNGHWLSYRRKRRILELFVNVTLDPDTAYCKLQVSDDRKTLNWMLYRSDVIDYPQRFSYSSFVLGCEALTSGRHYWEVKVGAGTYRHWAVGVAREAVKRKEKNTKNPEEGIWALKKPYSITVGSLPLQCIVPTRIGAYLDFEDNRVMFFDVEKEIAICSCPASFKKEKIRPFFWMQKEENVPNVPENMPWICLSS